MTHRVILHVGEPKTGTTFLQQVMWRNRDRLAAAGVVLPGHHPQDHFRASQDLRGMEKLAGDPAGSWHGEWDVLAGQARQATGAAVISHELYAAATPDQMARAVDTLGSEHLHVVLTVRDMATLLPAEWQESVKHRNTRKWHAWLGDVIDRESLDSDRRRFWFWQVHDTLSILDDWAQFLPREHIHVVTVPPTGAPRETLWQRFADVIGVDARSVDLGRARPNAALGVAETEFLRRMNSRLADEVPGWFYMAQVKEPLAHGALAARPAQERLVLPTARLAWAHAEGQRLAYGLQRGGFDIIGDLDDLLARDIDGVDDVDASAEALLDAAIDASAALVRQQYHRLHPAVRPETKAPADSRLPTRIESVAARSPRLKRLIRTLSSRYPTVRRLRVLAWRCLEATRSVRR